MKTFLKYALVLFLGMISSLILVGVTFPPLGAFMLMCIADALGMWKI